MTTLLAAFSRFARRGRPWRPELAVLLLLAGQCVAAQAPLYQAEAAYLRQHGQPPADYVLAKLAAYDVLLLGEDHAIRENLEFVGGLLPRLYRAGVYTLGLEFGAAELQGRLDSLLTAPAYSPQVARDLLYFYNVGWAYQEYADLYRRAWELNRSRPAGARRFRLLNLSYQYRWPAFRSPRTPESLALVFWQGPVNDFRARRVASEVLARGDKALLLLGTPHAFARHRQGVLHFNADNFCFYDEGALGTRLLRQFPGRVGTVLLHGGFQAPAGATPAVRQPADGQLEAALTQAGGAPVGFDLPGSPLGQLPDHSYFATGYPHLRLADLADGYVFLQPLRQLHGCTVDTLFLRGRPWTATAAQLPDPDWHRPATQAALWQQIRRYVDLPTRYAGISDPPVPRVASGTVRRLAQFPSRYVDARNVDVWLPPGYTPTRKYPVVYMHDGQLLFDSTATWNHQEWQVDEVLGKLFQTKQLPPCIVVGVWNNDALRMAEYFPQAVVPTMAPAARAIIEEKQLRHAPLADNYLKFLVTELKPYIDKMYSTAPDRAHTFLLGSSMGGLISLYGLCEYPQVFGGAACLSMHSPLVAPELLATPEFSHDQADRDVAGKFRDYLAAHLPPANSRRIYIDYGSLTLDSLYAPYQTKIDAVLRAKGYTAPRWQTRSFPGEAHTEKSWAKRLGIPFAFLLGK